MTEIAHEQAPEDMAVTDQLIESIATTEVGWIHHVDPNERINNPIYPGLLTELRMAQFEQIKRAVAQGGVPAWRDYVRVSDLILLLSARWSRDYNSALEPTQWLIAQAEMAGWTYCLPTLTRMEQAYASGEGYVPGLFLDPTDALARGIPLCSASPLLPGPTRGKPSVVADALEVPEGVVARALIRGLRESIGCNEQTGRSAMAAPYSFFAAQTSGKTHIRR